MRTAHKHQASVSEQLPRAVAVGMISTAVMSMVMQALYTRLPRQQQYDLPPEEITEVFEERILGKKLDEPANKMLTWVSHFGYGTTLGAGYILLASWLSLDSVLSGLLYGLGVWAMSYLGWLPAFRVLPPATEFPPERRRMIVIAHLVWGAALGFFRT